MVTRALRKVPAWAWFVLCVYVASRLLYLGIAGADVLLRAGHLTHEMSNWDGKWYLLTSLHGYPHTLPAHARQYSTLGFLPLYPLLIKALAAISGISHFAAGVTISMITGFIATLAMSRLVGRGRGAARDRLLLHLPRHDRLLDGLQRGPRADVDLAGVAGARGPALAVGWDLWRLRHRYCRHRHRNRSSGPGGCRD
jgi:hypothetical protein